MITNAENSDRTDESFHILFPFWPSMFTEKYTVLRQIYSANSNVYLVKNTDNNQIYVAKTFNEDCIWLWYRERNGNTIPMEIHVMEKLKGEQIINIVDHYYFFGNDHYYFSGQDANYYTIVMEYLGDDWCDLFEFLQHRPLSEYQALSIFKNILKGLIKIHQKGISHTDLKGDSKLT
jgi:serine/threonine protein kinase